MAWPKFYTEEHFETCKSLFKEGLKAKDIAKTMGVSQTQVSRWKRRIQNEKEQHGIGSGK